MEEAAFCYELGRGLLGQIQIVAPEIVMDAGEALFQIEPFLHGEEGLTALAEEFGMSVSTLSREFQKNLGQGFLDSLHQMRIEEAKYAIENTNASLNDIAISVGYTNTLTMTRAFKKYLGCTPGSFRKKEDIS